MTTKSSSTLLTREQKRDTELLNQMYSSVKLYEEQIEKMPPLRVHTPEYFKNAETNNISRSSSANKRIQLMNDVKLIKEGIKKLERKINTPNPTDGVHECVWDPVSVFNHQNDLQLDKGSKYWKAYLKFNGSVNFIGAFTTQKKAYEAYSKSFIQSNHVGVFRAVTHW